MSSYLIALFAGNSLPVIGTGMLSVVTNARFAHVTFAVVITALAGLAALAGFKYARMRNASAYFKVMRVL